MAPLAALLVQTVISSVVKDIRGRWVIRAVRGYIETIFWRIFLVLLHNLSNTEITKYIKYKIRFNDVFLRNIISRIKDGVCVVNLNDKNGKGRQWVSSFIDVNTAVYLDSFGIEYIPKDKSVTRNIFGIQSDDSIKCGFYCIAFRECKLAGKTLLGYIDLFSPDNI